MTRTGNRDRGLDRLLSAASAPACPDEQDASALDAILVAFNAAGTAEPRESTEPELAAANGRARARKARSAGVRPVQRGAWLTARSAAVLVIAAGGAVAAAGAGILPVPIQSLAHQVLGGIGVPAPKTNSTGGAHGLAISPSASVVRTPQSSATPSATPTLKTGASTSPTPIFTTPSAQSTVALLSLCNQVIDDGGSWQTALSQQDLAVLTAAAGTKQKIELYCAHLVSPAQQQQQPTTTPTSTTPSPTPSTSPANGNSNGGGNGNGGNGNGNGGGNGNGNGGNGNGNGGGNGNNNVQTGSETTGTPGTAGNSGHVRNGPASR